MLSFVQLPALGHEVVSRVVELLRLFNTRTCQLVLGAKSMQVVIVFERVTSYTLGGGTFAGWLLSACMLLLCGDG